MEKLDKWLSAKKMQRQHFAELVGTTPSMITRVMNGDQLPSLTLAAKIERVTKNRVPMKAWVEDQAI